MLMAAISSIHLLPDGRLGGDAKDTHTVRILGSLACAATRHGNARTPHPHTRERERAPAPCGAARSLSPSFAPLLWTALRMSIRCSRGDEPLAGGVCHAPSVQARVGSSSRAHVARRRTSRNSSGCLCPDARLFASRNGTELHQPERPRLIGRSEFVQPECCAIRCHDPECAEPECNAVNLRSPPLRPISVAHPDRAGGPALPDWRLYTCVTT